LPADARIKTVLLGANDATCITANSGFHVPLNEYKENLEAILSHSAVAAQNCRIVLITPPPIDEYQHEMKDKAAGRPGLTRFSHLAKEYAEACRQVGESAGVPVLDLWGHLMHRAGWREGDAVLAGSKAAPKNEVLALLLSDGECLT
jgi:isoamyl acetate esterase